MNFIKGDKVKSLYGNGEVWKISENAVHVRYSDGNFQKFFFVPKHHMQTNIKELIKI